MGIPNLLRILKDITTRKKLSEYKGKRAGIDGYTWLHRSLYCIGDAILKKPIDISRCISFFLNKLHLLLRNQIKPIFIFDGNKLPIKNNEEDKREKKRQEFEIESENYLKLNNKYAAICKKIESFDVTPEFAFEFMKILQKYHVEYYVAPYEADAQLAYLSYIGYVDFIITEDSDLIAYGCNCVLYKLGSLKNEFPDVGEEIKYENIKVSKGVKLKNFSKDNFLNFCILCGCDYLKILGVGPKLSIEVLNRSNDYKRFLGYIFNNKYCTKGSITETIENYEKAFLTFRYQVVYCPIEKKLRYFHDINEKAYKFLDNYKNDLSFLGSTDLKGIDLEQYIKGYINPITKEHIGDNSDKYYSSEDTQNIIISMNYQNNGDNDDCEPFNENSFNSKTGNGNYYSQYNFFPKMGKNKDKKNKKNEKPKNQCDIESFLGGGNIKMKKIKKQQKPKNIINNSNGNPKVINNENINNEADENDNNINDENKVNLNNFFDKYIFDAKNPVEKRAFKDLDNIKNNIHSKNCANSNLHLSNHGLNSCYNPLTQFPKTKDKSSIGSKQKKLYNKFNLKFTDETDKKNKDLGLELLDNYGFSETNYNSNKEIFTNPSFSNDIMKKDDNSKKINSKENINMIKDNKETKEQEENFIYIGDDDNSENINEIKVEKDKKDNYGYIDELNLDDYRNNNFILDKF